MNKYLSALNTAKAVYANLVSTGNSEARYWFETFTDGISEVIIHDDEITAEQYGDFIEIKKLIVK